MCFFAGILLGGEDDVEKRILQLARTGRNIDAIRVYESLPDPAQSDIAVLRAVAGCYWRERRFDEARVLYRDILERQSTLNTLGSGGQGGASTQEVPSAASETPVAAPQEPPPVAVAPPAESETNSPAAALEQPEPVAGAHAPATPELETLRAQYDALQAERDARRQEANARIAELAAAAAERSAEIDQLRARHAEQSEKAAAAESAVLLKQQDFEERTAVLNARVAALEQDLSAARMAHERLKMDTSVKMNDLLDAVETEKVRRERAEADILSATALLASHKASAAETTADLTRQVEEARERLARERGMAEAAAADHQLREVELRARVAQITATGEEAKLQVALLEQTLGQLRGRLDEVTAQLAVRDLEVELKIDRVDHATLALALDEIERLEQEQAAADAVAARQQALLQDKIGMLELRLSSADESLAAVRQDLDSERRQRFDLEEQAREQAKAFAETAAMLEDAKAALVRQYDALREHVQGGASIRIEGGETNGMPNARLSMSPDLVPMIGQLETATATAVAEVRQLREQLERDRAVLATVTAEKEAELSALRAEMATLQQKVRAISAEATGRESAMEAAHAAAVEAITRAHDLRVAGLKSEIDALNAAMATRERVLTVREAGQQVDQDAAVDQGDGK
jgi:chromosome segregation ATPase